MPDRQRIPPPDNLQRQSALDAERSVLVRAPAGSGKTDLLTRRFLRLLGEVNDPGEIVAITFTRAAAAEMRHRILVELEKAASGAAQESASDALSMASLAQRALARSHALGWNLIDLPAQLRISTIDSFCREIAMQEPILSGLGGTFEIHEQPQELYRRAARRTMEQIGKGDAVLSTAIERLLLWRDNNWADLENQLVDMLAKRDQWMHETLLDRAPDWDALRERLERPFAHEIGLALAGLELLFEQIPSGLEEAHELARFACEQSGGALHNDLAELTDFPVGPFANIDQLEEARRAYVCIADLVLTKDGFRRKVDKRHGFPADAKNEKNRLAALIAGLAQEPAFAIALAAVGDLPSARYSDEDWEIVRACFILLRHAAGELRVAFAEAGQADFIEIAQIAQRALKGEDDLPSDAAQAFADRIRHLLVDEFQDTSRRQHRLLAHLIAAWSGREGRTCFVVGDPMQSIYGFRDADAELFPRVESLGLEVPEDLPLLFDAVQLFANFRSAPSLVSPLNSIFSAIFAEDDGSGIDFVPAQSARDGEAQAGPQLIEGLQSPLQLHLAFMPALRSRSAPEDRESLGKQREAALEKQTDKVVGLIQSRLPRIEAARAAAEKYRIAVLGRARSALAPIARALREAMIPFRAVELEQLQDRPEIVDGLALVRALLNPEDRVAWLGVLRAPWCGLSLADLHTLASADDEELMLRPIPDLFAERESLLSEDGRIAVERVVRAIEFSERLHSIRPGASLGTRMEQVWLRMGGAQCVDAAARANLD
ncbi:MAG: UvrD-helicase domain-containing protein, partial [Terracidiphilus sp.]